MLCLDFLRKLLRSGYWLIESVLHESAVQCFDVFGVVFPHVHWGMRKTRLLKSVEPMLEELH